MIGHEQAIIGSICEDFRECSSIMDTLEQEHFQDKFCRDIFKICSELVKSNTPVDVTTVTTAAIKKGLFKNSFGEKDESLMLEMAEWRNNCIPHHWKTYAQGMRRSYVEQKTSSMSSQFSQADFLKKDVSNFLFETKNEIERLSKLLVVNKKTNDHETASEMYEDLFSDKLLQIPTGYKELDGLLDGGISKGELLVLAARPGMGKTGFAINMCLNAANSEFKTAFISVEMTKKKIVERMMAADGGIKYKQIKDCDDTARKFGEWMNKVNDRKILLSNDGMSDMSEISAYIDELKKSEEIDIVFIDYLGMMNTKHGKSAYEKVSYMSKALKTLATKNEIVIVLLVQLNRKVEARECKIPLMSDIRDSGTIEQHADRILMILRPNYYDSEAPVDQCNLYLNKNRHGPTGDVKIKFNGEYMKFTDPTINKLLK